MKDSRQPMNNLTELLSYRAANSGDKTWLYFQDKAYSYQQIWSDSARYRDELDRRHIAPGSHVLIVMDNGPTFFKAFFGIQRHGSIPVPLSPKSNRERLTYIVSDCNAPAIFTDQRFLGSRFADEELTPELRTLMWAGETVEKTEHIGGADRPPQHLAFIQYTSGSTGNAKGTMISHQAVLANIEGFFETFKIEESDVMSSMMPLFHDMGLICFGLGTLVYDLPVALYLQEAISLYHWLESFAKYKVTISGGPNIFLHLANKVVRDHSRYDLSTCKVMVCGSEPIFPNVVKTFEKNYKLKNVVKPAYGMAEISLCATITSLDDAYNLHDNRFVSCGKAIKDTEVVIRNDEGHLAKEPFVSGEVLIKSPSLMDGYLGRKRPLESFYKGYYRSGDEGFLDKEGRLYIVCRRKNLIIRGGEKFSPADLESLASTLPGVVNSAVVAQNNEGGEDLIVLVMEIGRKERENPANLEKLSAEICRESLQRFRYQPDRVLFTSKGSIPFTANGKLQHRLLRERLERNTFTFDMEIKANLLQTV